MVTMETVNIKVPAGMAKHINSADIESELMRNALLLYPHILKQTISHGYAAELLGITKDRLIDIYDELGCFYFDITMDELDSDLDTFRQLKEEMNVG